MTHVRHTHRRAWPEQVADDKRYGKATVDQLRKIAGILKEIPIFEREFAEKWNAENKSETIGDDSQLLNWSGLYELPFGVHVSALMLSFTSTERIAQISSSADPVDALLVLEKESDDPEFFSAWKDISKQDSIVILALLMSLTRNIKSMRAYGLSINELLSQAKLNPKFKDECILKAISIDPVVMGCELVSARICLAQISGDKVFHRRLRKALEGPHKGRLPFGELRVVERMLYEIGAYNQSSRGDLAALIIEKLHLYDAKGDNPLKGLFSRMEAYRKEATF